ncbi:MAG: division/cell wall cluster transcriptional repressor MraZ [Burkholderiales bacterium]|jgi:MraZ protein|nr:division/cell wall cluster transcriptional repressor MraZ [Burkholderiales bacterium]
MDASQTPLPKVSTPVFRGVTQLALDSKGRLAVPARYREALHLYGEGCLVITADPSRCLLVYPQPIWEPIQEKLMALSSFDERIRALQRLLVGYADDVALDGAGRALVSPALRQYAQLDHRVVLVGQGGHFELWDEGLWQAQMAQAVRLTHDDLPPVLDGFSL